MAGNANRYALSANTEDTDKIPIEARGATKIINDLDKSKTRLVIIQQKIYKQKTTHNKQKTIKLPCTNATI